MISEKASIQNLVEICVQKGIEKIIISPGSRNAPLILAFSKHPDIECLSIVDERSAAYFYLGLSYKSIGDSEQLNKQYNKLKSKNEIFALRLHELM